MTKEELAAKLNGREVGDEITEAEAKEAKYTGLVVVFGASDDLMEFEGAIRDEVGCFDGGTAYLTSEGLLENECDNEDCPHFLRLREKATTIEAIWNAGCSWSYETDIPHATFDIMEDGEKYCRGIVFALADVKEKEGAP